MSLSEVTAFLAGKIKTCLPRLEVSAGAVLEEWEEWDQSPGLELRQCLLRPDKEELLTRLTYSHLTGPASKQDLSENTVYQLLAELMRATEFAANRNVTLREVIDRSAPRRAYPRTVSDWAP